MFYESIDWRIVKISINCPIHLILPVETTQFPGQISKIQLKTSKNSIALISKVLLPDFWNFNWLLRQDKAQPYLRRFIHRCLILVAPT